jgi:hypothetical protein
MMIVLGMGIMVGDTDTGLEQERLKYHVRAYFGRRFYYRWNSIRFACLMNFCPEYARIMQRARHQRNAQIARVHGLPNGWPSKSFSQNLDIIASDNAGPGNDNPHIGNVLHTSVLSFGYPGIYGPHNVDVAKVFIEDDCGAHLDEDEDTAGQGVLHLGGDGPQLARHRRAQPRAVESYGVMAVHTARISLTIIKITITITIFFIHRLIRPHNSNLIHHDSL